MAAGSSSSSLPLHVPALTDEPVNKRLRGGRRLGGAAAAAAAAAAALPPPPAAPAAAAGAPPPLAAAPRVGTICYGYNLGKCVQLVCPRGFAHVCVVCGAVHVAANTDSCKNKIDKMGRKKRGVK